MNRVRIALSLAGLLALAGCNQGTAGGPGAMESDPKSPSVGQMTETFDLTVPMMTTNLKQNEKKSITVGVKRGKNFDEEISLKFEDVPKGVRLEPSDVKIKHGETEAKLSLAATPDAALGNFAIKVTGHPGKGADAHVDLNIEISQK